MNEEITVTRGEFEAMIKAMHALEIITEAYVRDGFLDKTIAAVVLGIKPDTKEG